MTIDATWGGSAANSYITLEDAAAFITGQMVYVTPWTAVTTIQQSAALLEATRHIDSLRFAGQRAYGDQALECPRDIPDNDPVFGSLSVYPPNADWDTRLRRDVQAAVCQQAIWLLATGGRNRHLEAADAALTEARRTAGPVTEDYKYSEKKAAEVVCKQARVVLNKWLSSPKVYRG
jgi:hypothetical protein